MERDSKGRFIKGNKGYWKGKKLPDIVKDKLSKAHKKLYKEGKNIPPSRKGISPPNKGVPLSEEVKEKISKSKLGVPSKMKGIARPHCRGENHPNWKGGQKRYYHLCGRVEYKKWRKDVFERDNFTCQECKKRGIYLEAHHIKSWAKYPKLRYELTNGLTLCKKCHKQTDNYANKKTK